MGKGGRGGHAAGSSAAAEGVRARRTCARRRLVSASLVAVAGALIGVGAAAHHAGLLAGGLAAGVVAWGSRPEADPDRWERGAGGEVATASILDALPRRFVVLHDRRLPGRSGNIDHLVIGPSGIWVVDTKVRRARLRIRRGQVWAGNHAVDPSPAARQCQAVAEALEAPASALVAVHGHGLRRRGSTVAGVRIIPAYRLVRRIRRRRRLTRAEVVRLAARADQLFVPFR